MGRKGRGIMGKYLGKEKGSIRCRDAAEYVGQEDSAKRVPAVWA